MPGHWWQFWQRPLAPIQVVIFTRSNCPLCDKAAAFLDTERQKHRFALEFRDIAGDPELTRLHGDWVPVVEVNGQVRFRGAINPVLWRRLLRNAERKS